MNLGSNSIKLPDNEHISQGSVLRNSTESADLFHSEVQEDIPPGHMRTKRRLQQAVVYGKAALKDFFKKDLYEADSGSGNPFDVAFADFLNAPSIDAIDFSEYNGKIGSRILITVVDDFKVTAVHLQIQNADGSMADEGYATQGLFETEWIFTATRNNPVIAGDKITVTASDLPGNAADLERII